MKTLVISFLPLLFGIVWSSPLYYKLFHNEMGMQCDLPSTSARFDCHPDPNPLQSNCVARGCCWRSANDVEITKGKPRRGQGIPFCYFPQNYDGYSISSLKETDYGYRAVLTRTSSSGWPDDVKTLTMDVWMETSKRLHFKVAQSYLNL